MAAPTSAPPRTGSAGPPNASGMAAPSTTTPSGSSQSQQQNLNQIVLEYLSKKGYNQTEAMLRKESAFTDAQGQPAVTRLEDTGARKYITAYDMTRNWVDNVLEIYKPELVRLLWPLFVYSFLNMMGDFYPRDGREFFNRFREPLEKEHEDDLRALSNISQPEHVQQNDIAQIYRNSKYRLSISKMSFATLVEFLESNEDRGGRVILGLITNSMDIRTVDRAAAGGAQGLQKLMAERGGDIDVPAEDEGIPGHHPGSANLDPQAPSTLPKLSLAQLPVDADLMEDVKAELSSEDSVRPPVNGQSSLLQQYEDKVKVEGGEEPMAAKDIPPYPPSTARDVAMEVQKVRESRDRFKIDGRTGGIGPGVSVTMFTFHNTFDSVNCIEFSGDNTLAAIGTAESYIRVWSLENQALTSPNDPQSYQPSSSRRLIGHSGPVYALSFSPSIATPEPEHDGQANGTTETSRTSQPRFLLSSSADATIRLWSLDTWTNVVVYRSHNSPVWDVRFAPQGHYFISCSADRTARLWSTPQITPLRLFVGHDSDVETLAWHPNGAYVFTGAGVGDRTVRMWSVTDGTQKRLFTGHTGNVTAVACSPSGKTLASADDRGDVILWDLASGRLEKRMRGHGRGGIWSLDWSVESSVLVSGGADGTVRVWDVHAKRETPASIKANGEAAAGAKVDGTTVGAGPAKAAAKSKKDVVVSPDQISAFPTKKSPVYKVRFTQMNLVVAGGAYLP